jgi:hypothetical protein
MVSRVSSNPPPADDIFHPVRLTYFNRPKRQLTAPAMPLELQRTQFTGPATSTTESTGRYVTLAASVSLLGEEQAADRIGFKLAAESLLSRRRARKRMKLPQGTNGITFSSLETSKGISCHATDIKSNAPSLTL